MQRMSYRLFMSVRVPRGCSYNLIPDHSIQSLFCRSVIGTDRQTQNVIANQSNINPEENQLNIGPCRRFCCDDYWLIVVGWFWRCNRYWGNLKFSVVSADDLSAFEAKSFDAVTMNYVLMCLGLHVKLNRFACLLAQRILHSPKGPSILR